MKGAVAAGDFAAVAAEKNAFILFNSGAFPGTKNKDKKNAAIAAPDALTLTADTVVAVAHDAAAPSSVVLPLLSGLAAQGSLPVCPSLRGQPCRDTPVIANTASTLP